MAAYNEEVLIRQTGGKKPVRLHRYLDEHRDKAELLNRLGCSAVKITDGRGEGSGGSGFLAKFCLANKNEFYALVTNEHIIRIKYIRSGGKFFISSELLRHKQETYEVDLSTCPFAFCSPRNFSSEDWKRIQKWSKGVPLTYPITTIYEANGPYLDVTVIELDENLVDQIGKDNFIAIDHLQHDKKATIGEKIFVLQYPTLTVSGATRHLCISTGVVSNYVNGKFSDYIFKHEADTLDNASGSPVLRWNGTVCGVHGGGKTQVDEPDDYNVAATMNVLIERLKAVRPQKP